MAQSAIVGTFPVRDKWSIRCQVTYYKGRGYFFSADPVEDLGNGLISMRFSLFAGRMEFLQEAKRFSRKTFDQLASQMRDACKSESPTVMRHVAEAAERVPKEVQRV
jgi:hypothetical protein